LRRCGFCRASPKSDKAYEPDTLEYTSSIDICVNEENVFIYVVDDTNTAYKLRF